MLRRSIHLNHPAGWLLGFTFVLLGARAMAAPVAYEAFAGYHLDSNLAAPTQPSPSPSTGLIGYSSPNTFLTMHARAGSLPFGPLETSGDRLEMDSGGVALTGALDTSVTGPFGDFVQNGTIGRDGTTLYLSFLYQLRSTSASGAQNYLQLKDGGSGRFLMGQAWNGTQFHAGGNLNAPLDTSVHLFVLRMEFRSGTDRVDVWLDPRPGEPAPPPLATRTLELSFDTLEFKAQGNAFYVDEIRFGSTWDTVLPGTPVYALTVDSDPNGHIVVMPRLSEYARGTEVLLMAEGEFGYRFTRWEGDVPSADIQANPLRIIMDRDQAVQARFAPGAPEFFTFDPGPDPYDASAIDLRRLNEPLAGQDGFVTRTNDTLYLGNGSPVRFWAANVTPAAGTDLDAIGRFLAKRGVNLVRWHSSVFNNTAPSLADVKEDKIDELHRVVSAMKRQGIYTEISFFFILGLRIQAEWGLDGYTQAWLDANPGAASEAPFGLQFFDEDFKAAYRQWLREILTRPNPHEAGLTPLKEEPAVAIIECQNEDNLFFWTFDPARYPPAARQKLEARFAAFLASTYGSLEGAATNWGSGGPWAGDAPNEGRMGLRSAWYMTGQYVGSLYDQRRLADQIAFLGRLQRDWYDEMTHYVRDVLGSRSLFTASNWTTADPTFLADLESYTYTAADIIDAHNYFSPFISEKAIFTAVSGGDRFYGVSAVNNPRRLPAAYKQVAGHPSALSEFSWTLPTRYKSEGPLLMAAYGAMADIDAFFWFALGKPGWQAGDGTWNFVSPAAVGQFPGAALLYRRGDVRKAPVVVREGRSLEAIYRKEPALIVETRGWDPTRDPDQIFNYDPESHQGRVDSLAMLVGKVELAFDGETDFVAPELASLIDTASRTVTSITGELELHWGQPEGVNPPTASAGEGWFRVDTPLSQGVAGWLARSGPLATANLIVDMTNAWGTVLATALDDRPLPISTQILIQAGTRDWLRGYRETPVTLGLEGQDYSGAEILEVGALPWQVEAIRASVTLKGMGTVDSLQALDGNGYVLAPLPWAVSELEETSFDLPAQALYTLVDLQPQTNYATWAWTSFGPAGWNDRALSDPSANPDEDAYPNRAEYVFDLDPNRAESSPILIPGTAWISGDAQSAEVTFRIRDRASDVGWRVEVSDDLVTWRSNDDGTGATATETVAYKTEPGGMAVITVREIQTLQPTQRHFLRLVTLAL